jgi:hypothetical protein
MKKILTLALALVLVFAIAAPAMAITDTTTDTETSVTPVDFVSVDVGLFSAPPAAGTYGGFAVNQVAANKAYVVNEVLFYGVALNFPKYDTTKAAPKMNAADYTGAKLALSSDAAKLSNPSVAYAVQNGVSSTFTWNFDAKGVTVDAVDFAGNLGSGNSYYAFGQGLVTAKGVLTAELAVEQELPLDIYKGTTKAYNVSFNADGNYYEVIAYAADGATEAGRVIFARNADKKVDHISVLYKGINFLNVGYNRTYGSGLQVKTAEKAFLDGSSVKYVVGETTGTYYSPDAAKAWELYESVMAFFGFDHTKDGVLLDKHFEAKASGLYLKDEAVVNLYTGSIEIPGGVVPPKTGDAASIMGFAMIVVALVACGVVVSRKVRA